MQADFLERSILKYVANVLHNGRFVAIPCLKLYDLLPMRSNHQGLLANKVFVVKFSAKNELFKFSSKYRPGAL